MAFKKDEVKYDELLVLKNDDGHGWRRKCRVVSFVINGVAKAPTIEARLYRDKDDHPYGRIVGFNFEDAKALVDNWERVRSFWFGK